MGTLKSTIISCIIFYCFTYNKLRKLKGGFSLSKICEYGCLECGMPIYNYEVDLLDGLCPRCYDSYYKELELVKQQYGEDSKEADNLKIRIANQESAINKTTAELKKYEDELKKQCEELLKSFDKLDDKDRQMEFNKMAIASMIIKQVIDSVKELGIDEFRKVVVKDDFIADIFRRIGMYNEIGVELGYAKRIEEENK